MSGLARRLERVAETLTAKERAQLVLHALKEERPVDPAWRRTMPVEQAEEFERYVALIYGLNVDVAWHLLVLHQEVEKLDLRLDAVATLVRSGLAAWQTWFFMMRATKEPVTESECRELEARTRGQLVPAAKLAEELVEEARGEPATRDEVWERLRGEKEQELATLVEQGTLVGSEQGGGLFLQAGSFYDWLGEPVVLQPAWALAYEVLPDEQAEQVRKRRQDRALVCALAEETPRRETAQLAGWDEMLVELAEQTPQDDLLARHVRLLRAGAVECWRRLRAAELVVEEVQQELGGDDPLRPDMREMLEFSRAVLESCKRAEPIIGPLVLEEPREADLAWLRGLMQAEEPPA